MTYLITFLEGIITFLSPCLLPMLPVYLSYFAGDSARHSGRTSVRNALGFVLGFTLTFTALGAFAGTLGGLLAQWQTAVNLVTGLVVILMGLQFLDVIHIPLFRGISGGARKNGGFASAVVLGLVFSIGWTPCVGAFLGSALMLASHQGSTLQGILLLLCYSIGLGVPFVVSALLIHSLTDAFQWVKAHYTLINRISGGLLIAMGVLMATGLLSKLLS